MSSIIESHGTLHEQHVDIHDDAALRCWSAHFGIRPKELKRVVRMVGNRLSDIDGYLAEAGLHPYVEDDNTEANPT